MWLQVINRVKVKSMSCQIEVNFKEKCFYAGGLHLNQMRSCLWWNLGQVSNSLSQLFFQKMNTTIYEGLKV